MGDRNICNICGYKYVKSCPSCAIRGKNIGIKHPRYNRNKHIQHYCIELNCNNKISYQNWRSGSRLCMSCSRKGIRNGRYIDGRMLKKYYCIDCNRPLLSTAFYGKNRCQSCAQKNNLKINGHPNKGKIWKYSGWRGKGGYYKKIWMRSTYELVYAKYLDKYNIEWLYEPKAFDLGNTTYRPDFYLVKVKKYIEIKGWLTKKAKDKINKFKKLFPKINFEIIGKNKLIKLGLI